MRLGGPVHGDTSTPEAWVERVREHGYRAAYCPLKHTADEETVRAYTQAAAESDVVIAEVGAWSNPLSPDEEIRRQAVEFCRAQLHLADRIGARCCVNIAGSRGPKWDGPSPLDLTRETFAQVVETVREIIDAVQPVRTYYCLETMPWMFPDSPDSYVELIRAIDRPRFAVHLDPVNLVNCPQRYFGNAELLRECFAKLGPWIKSCHAKDILMADRLTVHLDEVRPGAGALEYRVFLEELSRLDPDTPLMLEHLPSAEEYDQAAAHVRGVAREMGVSV